MGLRTRQAEMRARPIPPPRLQLVRRVIQKVEGGGRGDGLRERVEGLSGRRQGLSRRRKSR